jgi:hypothetical protein
VSRDRAGAGRKAQERGVSWENAIAAANRGYETQNVALVERVQLSGKFYGGEFHAAKSPVDFQGDIKVGDRFVPVRFDAKETSSNRWDFSEWKPTAKKHHQLIALRHMARFGGLSFALVRQSKMKWLDDISGFWDYPAWLVPLPVVDHFINLGQWSMSVEFLNSAVAVLKVRGGDWLAAAVALTQSAYNGKLSQ